MTTHVDVVDGPARAQRYATRFVDVEEFEATARGGEMRVTALAIGGQSGAAQMQAERGVVDRIDEHVAFRGLAAEVALVGAERREAQDGAMRLDARQKALQKAARLQPGVLFDHLAAPSRIEDQRAAAKIAADGGEMDEMFERALARLVILEDAEFQPSSDQGMHADDLESSQSRGATVDADVGRRERLSPSRRGPGVVGGDLQALGAERPYVRKQRQMMEGRQGEVGYRELHDIAPGQPRVWGRRHGWRARPEEARSGSPR